MRPYALLCGAAVGGLLAHAALAGAVTLKVGPAARYRTISTAVAAADVDTSPSNVYLIEVAPGTYLNDFPVVTRPMTIEVDPAKAGKQVILKATVPLPNEKGIILNLSNLTVDGLTFEGARISNALGGNGAGIRDQNTGSAAFLIVRNSSFIGNQEGILTGDNPSQTIDIIKSVFKNNGNPNIAYFQHALYVNHAASLTVTSSVFCGQLIGHDVKSRAMVTSVSDSRLYDGEADAAVGCRAGSSSFAVDVPEGGVAAITGNAITQGVASPNYKIVAYGEEGLSYNTNSLLASDNTFNNVGSTPATGIYDPYCVAAELTGNTFTGVATPVSPPSCAVYQ